MDGLASYSSCRTNASSLRRNSRRRKRTSQAMKSLNARSDPTKTLTLMKKTITLTTCLKSSQP